MPWLRVDPRRVVPPDEVPGLPRREVPLTSGQVCRTPARIGLVVFPAYAPGRLEVRPCPPSETALELLQHCVEFGRRRERAIRQTCSLAGTWPAVRLSFESADGAARLIARAYDEGRAGNG